MKIKELIEKLQNSAARYGLDTEVVLMDYENGSFVCMPVSSVEELSEFGDVAYPYISPDTLPAVIIS